MTPVVNVNKVKSWFDHGFYGVNLIYFLNGNTYFPKSWWSELFGVELTPLPDLTPNMLVKFLENEHSLSVRDKTHRSFYGFYRRSRVKNINNKMGNIPISVIQIASVVAIYDGEFLCNFKNRYIRNGQKIRLKDPIAYAWNQFYIDK